MLKISFTSVSRAELSIVYRLIFMLFAVVSFIIFISCKSQVVSGEVLLPDLAEVPDDGIIHAYATDVFSQITDNVYVKVSPWSTYQVQGESGVLLKGSSIEYRGNLKNAGGIFQSTLEEHLIHARGMMSYCEFAIPDRIQVNTVSVQVKYVYNESEEYSLAIKSEKGVLRDMYRRYSFVVPFNVLWDIKAFYLNITVEMESGVAVYKYTDEVISEKYEVQVLRFSPVKSKEIVKADRSKYKSEQAARWALWPVVTGDLKADRYVNPLSDMSMMTSSFGLTREWRLHSGKLQSKDVHLGIDYYVPQGTPVYSAGDGSVVFSGNVEYYGNMVIVDHGMGVYLNYCHLDTYLVNVGDIVTAGSQIGTVGMTGASTGPHLHWELRVHGFPVSPLMFPQVISLRSMLNSELKKY